MTYLAKPKLHHPSLPTNALGYTRRDYEGAISTLCAGCGHDSISAAIIQAFFELDDRAAPRGEAVGHRLLVEDADLLPRPVARLQQRARPHAVGADRRDPRQPRPHLPRRVGRRRLGVDRPRPVRARACGAASTWSTSSRTTASTASPRASSRRPPTRAARASAAWSTSDEPIDLVMLALTLGATFVARGFSGDKDQLVPLIKAAIAAQGRRVHRRRLPCVAFNNHPGSTKSYDYVREHNEAVNLLDFMPDRAPRSRRATRRATRAASLLHDGGSIRLRKLGDDYDPLDKRRRRWRYLEARARSGRSRDRPALPATTTPPTCTTRRNRRGAAQCVVRRGAGAGQRRAGGPERVVALTSDA